LNMMQGTFTNEQIADRLMASHPNLFKSQSAALTAVGRVTQQFSE
jgi:hypothetical protein